MVARLLYLDRLLNELFEILIGAATRQHTIQIMVEVGEETGADFAIGGEADAAAGSAKSLRYGRDDADFSDAVVEGVAARGFTGIGGGEGNQRAKAVELAHNLLQRDDHLGSP